MAAEAQAHWAEAAALALGISLGGSACLRGSRP